MRAELGKKLHPGDVVQINPERFTGAFRGCFVTVSGVGPSGIQGYVTIPDVANGHNGAPPGKTFVQLAWFQIEFVGRAEWP